MATCNPQRDRSWVVHLDDEDREELASALSLFTAWARGSGRESEIVRGTHYPSTENFPLPNLSRKLKQTQRDLEEGYGVALLKVFPLNASEQDTRVMFGGLAAYIGTLMPQTVNRELLQPVQDGGQAPLDGRRGSKYHLGLPVHNDGCDAVGFLCRRTPLKGGTTILVSASAVHNRMLDEHPDLLEELYQPFYNSWQDYQFPGGINDQATSRKYGLSRT